MARNDNAEYSDGQGQKPSGTALLGLGPRKKPCRTDPYIGYGRHFGRTIHAFCNIQTLLTEGLVNWVSVEEPGEGATPEQIRECKVFKELLALIPGLQARFEDDETSDEEVSHIAAMLQKGANSARSDDTKSLKTAVIDWITPPDQPLIPPLHRNQKMDRGFNHDATGMLLCPAGLKWEDFEVREKLRNGTYIVPGDQWPIFMWKDCKYDENDPWKGLLRSIILVKAFRHVFTSPSSVDQAPKATRQGNAKLHNMNTVNIASLAYIATQVRFSLSSASVFTRSDSEFDSVRFYNSIIAFLEDPDEEEEVKELLTFWNRLIFPGYSSSKTPITKDSALSRLKQRRAERRRLQSISNTGISG